MAWSPTAPSTEDWDDYPPPDDFHPYIHPLDNLGIYFWNNPTLGFDKDAVMYVHEIHSECSPYEEKPQGKISSNADWTWPMNNNPNNTSNMTISGNNHASVPTGHLSDETREFHFNHMAIGRKHRFLFCSDEDLDGQGWTDGTTANITLLDKSFI